MNVVLLFLLLIFELIQQAALVNFKLFLNILKIAKISFWFYYEIKICIGQKRDTSKAFQKQKFSLWLEIFELIILAA